MRIPARLVPQSLTGRVFALYAVTLSVFLAVAASLFYYNALTSGIEDALSSAQILSEVVTPTVTDSVVIGDYDTIKRTLAKAIQNSPFASASFIDVRGGTISVERSPPFQSRAPAWLNDKVAARLPDINSVIAVGGRDYGVLRLRFAPQVIATEVWGVTTTALALVAATLLGGLALIRISLRRWLDPLERFRQFDAREAPAGQAALALERAPIEIREALAAFARTETALEATRVTAAATLDAVGDAVLTTDQRGRILYANPAALRLLAPKGGDLQQRDVHDVLPTAFAAQDGSDRLAPWTARRAEIGFDVDRIRYLDTSFTPISDRNGAVIGHVLTLRDVTAAQEYESRLSRELTIRQAAIRSLQDALRGMLPASALGAFAASDTDLEAVSRLVADLVQEREASHRALGNQKFALDQHAAVSIADASGTITYANEKFSELSGYAVDELVGSNHRMTSSHQHPAQFYAEIWERISRGEVWHGEILNRHKNGTLYWVATTIVPWLDDHGRPVQYIAIRTDVTPQKRVEQALEDARRRELRTGLEIQRSLLIGELPTGISGAELASYAEPSQGIDGDFYAFTTFRPDCFELLVGDVMGKGVPAALIGAAVRTAYNQVVTELMAGALGERELPRPADIVNALHARLTPRLIELETFITLALYRFDVAQGRLTFVNAGHTAGLLLRHGGEPDRVVGENLPVGVIADERYEESTRAFGAGDALLVYSDGITEARAGEGQEFGEQRLHGVLLETSGRGVPAATCLQALRKRVRDFVGERGMADDQTAVMVKFAPPPGLPGRGGTAAPLEQTFELPWDFSGLGTLRERVAAGAAGVLGAEAIDRLVLASFEAATNVVRHVAPPFPEATLCCRLRPALERLTVELWYVGLPFERDPGFKPDFSGEREGGFGLYIIDEAVSRVTYEQPALDVCCTRLVQVAHEPAAT